MSIDASDSSLRWDFFLSFSSPNREHAERAFEAVEAAGYTCFFQHDSIEGGANFVKRMTEGLEGSTTMLALFSPAYFASKFAQAELHGAFARDPLNESRSILPFLIDKVDIPAPFNALNYIDCVSITHDEFRAKLLKEVFRTPRGERRPADPRIPETDTPAAAQKLLDDLNTAYAIFSSQCEVRDALVEAMLERDPGFERLQYEEFFARYYERMEPDERRLHERIRQHTETIEKLNRRALYRAQASRSFRSIPLMGALIEHLVIWLDKFDRIFHQDPSVGVLYAGVVEGKKFPSGVEDEIRKYIDERR